MAVSGARIVVGAYRDDASGKNAGTAWHFDLNGTTPGLPFATLHKPSPAADDHFGRAVAIDGATVVIGTPRDDTTMRDKGAVHVFEQ